VFEHCILKRFESLFVTSKNQLGFKKGSSCNHAIRVVRSAVDDIIRGGSTANLCSTDLSKAFDKVNHHALYLKLMERFIPNELLALLEFWLSSCYSRVKWDNAWSDPFLFAYTRVAWPTLVTVPDSELLLRSRPMPNGIGLAYH